MVIQESKHDIISTGYKILDEILSGGFHKGEVVIIASRPSMGKTALALSLVMNITINNSISTGFVSLEMDKEALCKRLFGQNRNFTQKFDAIPLHIIDTPNMTIEELTNTIKDLVRVHQIKLVFIDYLGLLDGSSKNDTITKIKSLAVDLGIVIIALSQLPRNAEGKPPDLKFSTGFFKNDADVVVTLNRDGDMTDGKNRKRRLFFLKNKDRGRLSDISLNFIPEQGIFEE
jgi:replicative DNA helicase